MTAETRDRTAGAELLGVPAFVAALAVLLISLLVAPPAGATTDEDPPPQVLEQRIVVPIAPGGFTFEVAALGVAPQGSAQVLAGDVVYAVGDGQPWEMAILTRGLDGRRASAACASAAHGGVPGTVTVQPWANGDFAVRDGTATPVCRGEVGGRHGVAIHVEGPVDGEGVVRVGNAGADRAEAGAAAASYEIIVLLGRPGDHGGQPGTDPGTDPGTEPGVTPPAGSPGGGPGELGPGGGEVPRTDVLGSGFAAPVPSGDGSGERFGRLPFTGADVATLFALALLLLVVGAAGRQAARRLELAGR